MDTASSDPAHEYDDVQQQMAEGAMTGFSQVGGPSAMLGFETGRNPVLTRLAENGLLMDNWFSSMPGPTWPNRFFAHAASSGGLDNSPSGLDVGQAVSSPNYSYQFERGHIFDRLIREGKSWRVYRGDSYPQVLALRGMIDKRLDRMFFRSFKSEFKTDLASAYEVAYTFIEPDYDTFNNYAQGNSQHPLGSVSAGEKLVSDVYQAIFKQPNGASSVLLVVWDEHGGFFDHVAPPAAVPPGDPPLNYQRAATPRDCKFDRFGPRVPALLLSPWLPVGLGSRIFPGQYFDHASIISSLRLIFQLGEPLTNRDASAPSWHTALLSTPRELELTMPRVAAATQTQAALTRASDAPGSASLLGTLQIAVKMDWDLAARTGAPPLVTSEFQAKLAATDTTSGGAEDGLLSPDQRQSIVDYLAAVHAREESYSKASQRDAAGPG
ncbi:MAG: hypothetical protein JWQ07_86 [Ramlibacter sp.]|nr:hypothetical protein [Ramlibacter sp.]